MASGVFPRTHSRLRVPLRTAVVLLLVLWTSIPGAAPGGLKGRIRGTIRDLKGKPVAGLMVQLLLSGKGLIHITNTDDRGIYAFEDLAAGSYDVEVRGAGYQRQIKKAIVVQPPFRNIVDFSLPPGPLSEGVASSPVIYQPPAGEPTFQNVTGTFTDKDRRPIPDVLVVLTNPVTGSFFRSRSDREGKLLIRGVPVGTYRVAIASPGYVTVELRDALVDPASGMTLQLSLVEFPLNFQGRPGDLTPEEDPVPPDYRPPAP